MPESNPFDFPGINVKWGMAAGGYLSGTYPNPNVAKIKGTITNDNATAGDVGEYVSSIITSGSAVALTTGTAANITSISLTAGDWDVWVCGTFTGGVTTTVLRLQVSTSSTSATLDATASRYANFPGTGGTNFASDGNPTVNSGPSRFSLSATTTIYFVAEAAFGISICSAYGGIFARRAR